MSRDNLKETLETFSAVLDDIVTEPIGEHFAWQWGYCDARAFALQDIAEVLEVRVAAAHDGMFQFEGGDVGSAYDLVRRVHVPGGAMGLGVADLVVFCQFIVKWGVHVRGVGMYGVCLDGMLARDQRNGAGI